MRKSKIYILYDAHSEVRNNVCVTESNKRDRGYNYDHTSYCNQGSAKDFDCAKL